MLLSKLSYELSCCCSAAKSSLSLCDHIACSTPGSPVPPCLPEFAHIRVHWVDDAIWPSHPLLPPVFPSFWVFCQLFASGGQNIGASASALPMRVQDWSPLGWTGWISLQSKGLSRVFCNTTIRKHQFFSAQPTSQQYTECWLYRCVSKVRDFWPLGVMFKANILWKYGILCYPSSDSRL